MKILRNNKKKSEKFNEYLKIYTINVNRTLLYNILIIFGNETK